MSMSMEAPREAAVDNNVAQQRATLRKAVLQGGFSSLPSNVEWKVPTFKLLVFVSSTFTDTQAERNFLMDELIFEMRALAKPLGVQVIFVDMRWGVRDENSCDHKTWVECSNALNWCKTESMGIFFLSLQADKYGYTPLPKTISKEAWDRHLGTASSRCTQDQRDLLHKWYVLDDNSLTPEYLLRNLSDHNDPEYWKDFGSMLSALRGIEFDMGRYKGLYVGRSVTEWEVRAALDPFPVDRNDDTSLFWSHRKFASDAADSNYCDTSSNDIANNCFRDLLAYMDIHFPTGQVQRYSPQLTLQDLLAGKETAHGVLG